MNTNFKVIGLTRHGIKPQSIQLPRRRLLLLGHLSCKSHVKVQINRSSILAVEQNFAFMGYKTILVIFHTSGEKSENFRGGRAGLIANDRGNSFSFALTQQPLKKFFIWQGGWGCPSAPPGYIPDEMKSFNTSIHY